MADISNYPNLGSTDEIIRLRAELEDLLNERDDLIYIECENIRARYVFLFAGLEYKIIKLQFEYQKLKAKLGYLEIAKNHKQDITADIIRKIDNEAELEFIEYRKILNDKAQEIKWADEIVTGDKLNGESFDDFKYMYREIVRRINPDLNPEVTDEGLDIYNKAVEAYKNGWYGFMELYYELVIRNAEVEIASENHEEEIRRLKKRIKNTKNTIATIKESFPYDRKEMVYDQAQIDDYREKLDGLIGDYELEIEKLNERIAEFIKDSD